MSTPEAVSRPPDDQVGTAIKLGVLLASLSVLAIQIAMNRIFSFTLWYHFAYISISLVLLGFGASGSLLAAFPALAGAPGQARGRIGAYFAVSAAFAAAMCAILGIMQVNPFFLHTSAWEFGKFLVLIVSGSLPFLFVGMAISLALTIAGEEAGRLYAWDLVGAGIGCALVVPAIEVFETPRTILLAAALLAVAALVVLEHEARGPRRAAALLGAAIVALAVWLPASLEFPPTRDKDIARWLEYGGTSYFHRWGSLFRTDLIGDRVGEASHGGYADTDIGLSPKRTGTFSPFRMIEHDGGAGAIMYIPGATLAPLDFLRNHILTIPYVLKPKPDVLVIGVGGGTDIANGVVNGARSITGVELDPLTIRLITKDYGDLTRAYIDRPEVSLQVGEGRSFVRSTDRRFDLIQITGVDTLAAMSSGAYVLAENFLYTVEAYEDFLSRLAPGGLLSICSADRHPGQWDARHAARFASLSAESLRRRGVEHPGDHIVMVGSSRESSLFEIVTSVEPLTAQQIDAVRSFANDNGFEVWYAPGQAAGDVPDFRVIIEGGQQERSDFYAGKRLAVEATTDDRPFFFSYYKWRNLLGSWREIDRGHTLATGQIVLALLLVTSIVTSILAILLPLVRMKTGAANVAGRAGFLAYFCALGAGFIFLEISFVQRFVLFLGYPTYSLTVTLFSFLVFAGLGSAASTRLADHPQRVLPKLLGLLCVIVVAEMFVLPRVFDSLLGAPLGWRMAATILACAPLGGVLGVFFPFGIRHVSTTSASLVAWAWAVNACFTVVGSVASVMLAMTWGFGSVAAAALAIYAGGVAAFVAAARKRVAAGA